MAHRHFDLPANEAELRRVADEAVADGLANAADDNAKRFIETQHRLRDLGILPRLEAMRHLNDGVDVDEVIAAVAIKTGVALYNIADLTGRNPEDVAVLFSETLISTLERMEDLDRPEADDEGGANGRIYQTREFFVEGGNA